MLDIKHVPLGIPPPAFFSYIFLTDGILSDFVLDTDNLYCLYLDGLLPGCLKSLHGLSWILGVVAFALVGGCTTHQEAVGGSG